MKSALTAAQLMAKASRAGESAKALFDLGDPDGACNRAYYAMFDAARAVLMMSGVEQLPKTHSGLLALFSEKLVKNGPLDTNVGKFLKRAEQVRLVADYLGDGVTIEDARLIVEHAAFFVAEIAATITRLEPDT